MGDNKKMQRIGFAFWMLLGITSAYSIIGSIPPESPILTREKRSFRQDCNKDVVKNLAKSAQETCSQIGTIDKHIANIKARKSLPVPSFTDRHGFKGILNQYNGDLKRAKDHCHPWRNSANIVGSLKEMVVAAQGFEPKFNQEFTKNQARVKNILENHEDIAVIEAKISALQKDIKEAREAAAVAVQSTVVAHLKRLIKSKEEKINSIIKEHEVAQALREVAELVTYLEFVKSGAAEIEGKAESAKTKISNFRDSIVRDGTAFKRHRTNAQRGITKLQQEKQNNNNELNSNRQSITTLRTRISKEQHQITSLNGQIQNSQRELGEIKARISRIINETRKTKNIAKWIRWMSVVAFIIGTKVHDDAKEKEESLARERINLINEYTRMVQNIQADIARRNQDIATHRGRINSLEAKSRQLEQELQHFSQLYGNLQSVESEVNVILPTIANAVNGLNKLRETFGAIKQSLEDVISRAKDAKTEAELKNIKFFIYNEIDELKCKWDSARDKIIPVGECD